ncbi:MAG: endonuclease MutS2, partial [Bacteroidota bacterium]
DESATGQTVYLEPAEIIDINNGIRELRYKERREIIRILVELTSQVRPHVKHLQQAYHFLGIMDFIQAKAKFALSTHSVLPKFEKKTIFDWKQAFHPLLYLTLKEQDKKVVPLSLSLDREQRVLLISGPNAGGKSVSLKTVGLLQYMFQSGLLVPMKENSTIGLFKDIFIDIGDEQSIENDLSTYSSHLTSMKYFLKFADKHTLFLIDEFGAGTEPAMGGAISEAILEKLNRSQAFGIVTTHYTNLKVLAEKQNGLVNGAMQFDAQHLEPLYRLEVGKPGSSYAFEIAKKIGLPEDTINRARKFAGKTQVNYDQLLRDLEKEKEYFATQNRLTEAKESKLKEVVEEYENLRKFLDEEKSRIINKAKTEAQRILKESNQKIENTIRVIKDQKAEKQITKQVRQELESFKKEVQPEKVVIEEEEEAIEAIEVIQGDIQIGDSVRIKGQLALG